MKIIYLCMGLLLANNSFAVLDVEEWVTPEGSKVLFSQTKGLPIVDIQLNFNAASSKDGKLHGLANITNGMIGMASKWKNEEEIINQFEMVGAQFGQESLKDMSVFNLRSLSRKSALNQAVETFAELISEPVFTSINLRKEKKRIGRVIEYNKQSVGAVAKKRFGNELFAGHPYGHSKNGSDETLRDITVPDAVRFYNKYYVAKNLSIAIVGDIDRSKAKQIARQITHKLNIGKRATDGIEIGGLEQGRKVSINYPSKQTHILIGQTGINRSDPDYYSLYLGNHILGGNGLTSILSEEIREKEGLAYSIDSQMGVMASRGYFLITMQTRNEEADNAEKLVLETLKRWVDEGPSEQELVDGKANIIGGWSLGISTNSDITSYLSIMGFYDMPNDWLESYIGNIAPIQATDIKKAFSKLIDMDKLLIVRAGGVPSE